MKRFFLKKQIFALLLLVPWLCFSIANLVYGWQPIAEEAAKVTSVATVSDIRRWTSDIEATMGDKMLARMAFIESYGLMQKLMGKKEFNNFSYIKDDTGGLYYGSTWQDSTDDVKEYAIRLQRAVRYVESKGINALVVLPPSKILPGMSEQLDGLPLNDPNARMDKLMLWMQYLDVPALDLRPAMVNSGYSQQELFFDTDHHWTPLASFIASKEVVETIDTMYGDSWDPDDYYLNLNNYNSHTYPSSMLGSLGRNSGMVYSGLDDYTMLWPGFDTSFTWTNNEKNTRGDFTQSLLLPYGLSFDRPYNVTINTIYLNEISNRDTIVNLNRPDAPRLAVVRDSYFSPMACFLAPVTSEIDMIWSLNTKGYDVEQFIREADCDYMIFEFYPYNLNEEAFDFFDEVE